MEINVIKPIVCKGCSKNYDLNECKHPAGWSYTLCSDCIDLEQNKGTTDDAVKESQCTCMIRHPYQCIVHGPIAKKRNEVKDGMYGS